MKGGLDEGVWCPGCGNFGMPPLEDSGIGSIDISRALADFG